MQCYPVKFIQTFVPLSFPCGITVGAAAETTALIIWHLAANSLASRRWNSGLSEMIKAELTSGFIIKKAAVSI